MAGITAARECMRAGLSVVVVEARDRVGGRICSDRDFCGVPVETGAEFIHTVEADTWPEVRALGLSVRPCDMAGGFLLRLDGKGLEEVLNDPDLAEMGDLLGEVESYDGPDVSAAEYIEGKGFRGLARGLAEMTLTTHPAGDADELSMVGIRDDRVIDLERGLNHRVDEGYDTLPRRMAEGLDVRLGWTVATVAWSGDAVTVRSTTGEEITARAAVCTLPVGVLKAGTVRFDPPLPPGKQQALAGLEMGAVVKVLYHFTESFWPDGLTVLGCDGPIGTWWPPLHALAGNDVPAVLTAYVTGHRAKALSAMSEDEAAAIGLDDLARLFPGSDPHGKLVGHRRIDWPHDPYAVGGYSFVRVGGAGSRGRLAAADTGALYWAGDATSTTTIAAVVHAAYATGHRAAAEVQAHLA
jgi:monoamine oxidase